MAITDGNKARPDLTNNSRKKTTTKKKVVNTYRGGSGGGSGTGGSSGYARAASSGGGGGGGYNPNAVSGAERRANALRKKQENEASKKYQEQAKTLGLQLKALDRSLSSAGFKAALEQRLANANLVYTQQDTSLLQGYGERVGDLKGSASDNTKALGDTSQAAMINRNRERTAAMKEAAANGAGESDTLATQLMSLRSWDSNQGEANRSFFDTLRSINTSLGDLNVDTRTARVNAASQLNNDKDQLYTQYFNQQAEAQTQRGNVLGQQAELYGLANEQKGSKKVRAKRSAATKASGSAFMSASKWATKAPVNPGVSKNITEWKGEADIKGRANNTEYREPVADEAPKKKPAGATLRAW